MKPAQRRCADASGAALRQKMMLVYSDSISLIASKTLTFFLYWRLLPLAAKFSGRGAIPHRR
jgi:hypothetical protein